MPRASPGSPPRVRGTDALSQAESYLRGITPACAGNRHTNITFTMNEQDHPRVCGEQYLSGARNDWRLGSPPRVRGTVIGVSAAVVTARITPACAGNSSSKRLGVDTGKDHPRVCGEQFMLLSLQKAVVGSPPRVRGTGPAGGGGKGGRRITPACAGNRISPDRGAIFL